MVHARKLFILHAAKSTPVYCSSVSSLAIVSQKVLLTRVQNPSIIETEAEEQEEQQSHSTVSFAPFYQALYAVAHSKDSNHHNQTKKGVWL